MTEDEKGFTVVDRRPFDDAGNPRQDEPTTGEDNATPDEIELDQNCSAELGDGQRYCLPPVDFSGLVLSLATAAMTHLGAMPDPASGQTVKPDLALARHSIDTLGMLKEKTAGNLSDDERRLLDNILTDLRLAYVRMGR